ncbi:MAG: hypothetical protein NTV97_17225 [Alphaproteobacteria bacterium]|nr:hypothetical protein [Alphaproteobacteria bacterium]
MSELYRLLEADLAAAERKAWESLARYKFWMFGYHAADWVKIARRLGGKRPNPFKSLVHAGRERIALSGLAVAPGGDGAKESMS